jgi:hypothetical protein
MPEERHVLYSLYLLKLYRVTIGAIITGCLPHIENTCLLGVLALYFKPCPPRWMPSNLPVSELPTVHEVMLFFFLDIGRDRICFYAFMNAGADKGMCT